MPKVSAKIGFKEYEPSCLPAAIDGGVIMAQFAIRILGIHRLMHGKTG